MTQAPGKQREFWKEISRLLRPRGTLFLILVVNVIGGLLSGAGDPFFLKLLIDSLGMGNTRRFVGLAVVLIGVYTAVRILSYFSAILTVRVKNGICEAMTGKMFRSFYQIPYERVAKNDEGYFISRIYDESSKLTSVVDLLVSFFTAASMLVGGIIICLWVTWEISLVLFVIVPCILLLAKSFGSRIRKSTDEEVENEALLREGLARSVRSYRTVRLFSLQGAIEARVHGLVGDYLAALYERIRLSALFQTISSILLSYAEMAVMLGVGFLVLRGQVTIGGMFGFTSAYWRVVNGFRAITNLAPEFARIQAQMSRFNDFEGLVEPSVDPSGVSRVTLRNGSFSYGDVEVIRSLDLDLKPGERVLVLGANGTGKSTLANIVTGFLRPQTGAIEVPDFSRVSALLLPFAFIPGTLEENVDFDNLPEVKKKLFLSMVSEFGIEHALGKDPEQLSEGEKRKAQVCMTLLKEADLYVLDEPLANIDLESHDRVMERIFEHTAGRGLMVIMHGGERFRSEFERTVLLEGPGTLLGEKVQAI